MKKIFYPVIILLIVIIFSAQAMAQTENKTVAFKTIYNSAQADRILANEIKKKQLLQTPSFINNLLPIINPIGLKVPNKSKKKN